MKYRIGILTMLLCLSVPRLATGTSTSQDENKPANSDAKHTTPDSKTKKPGLNSTISLHIKISEQGKALPVGSSIELKGSHETCGNVERTQTIQLGEVTFPDLPVCKVQLRIIITGFDVLPISVDLMEYKDPMLILVKAVGTPEVKYGTSAPGVESRDNQPQELAKH